MESPQTPEPAVIESVESIWGEKYGPAGCLECERIFLIDPDLIGKEKCPACGIGVLSAQPALMRTEPPEVMIPNSVSQLQLQAIFAEFVGGVWLHSDDFTWQSLLARARPVFIPMWLVDSDIAGIWQAETGFNYEVKSSEEYYSGGTWRSREKIETRIKWEPRTGQVQRHYDNVAVAALSDIHKIQTKIGAFEFSKSQRYQPDDLNNGFIRAPDIHPDAAWSDVQASINRLAAKDCKHASDAQHVRDFSIKARFENLNWTQLLLPVFMTWYTDDSGKPQIVYVNGQNGKIGGLRLASQRKGWQWAGIVLGVAAALFIAGLLLLALGALLPPIVTLGVLLIVAALVLSLAAIVPAAWPWQWNRKQGA